MRIAGINIPDEKRVAIALRYIYGVGPKLAMDILAKTGINPDTRAKDLTPAESNKVKEALEGYRIEGELRSDIKSNINRLKEINSYRGSRHTHHLPARGQRTKTNTRTVRGNIRRTATSGKRKVELK